MPNKKAKKKTAIKKKVKPIKEVIPMPEKGLVPILFWFLSEHTIKSMMFLTVIGVIIIILATDIIWKGENIKVHKKETKIPFAEKLK